MINLEVSTAFDTYRIIRCVGEGGSGRVYEVRGSDGERFALKCLKSQLSTSKRKRFQNEIRFCQTCQHANIVRVVDTGATLIDGEMIRFYVMPFCSKTLRTIMRGGIAPDAALPLYAKVLDGVEAAHLLGVCHRDLKPENILFEDGSGQLVIADFGAAEFATDEHYTLVETQDRERIGNFQYSAPEQRRAGGKVDHRSDIYALGLILNEIFTGEVPEGTAHRQIASVSSQHAYLDGLVDAMRSQNPDARPNSIADVKGELLARGNEFIALQKLNAFKNAVTPSTASDDPLLGNPVHVIAVDYDGQELHFMLDPAPPNKWMQVFSSPRSNYSTIQNQTPGSVRFSNNRAVLRMQPHAVDSAVRIFKDWVLIANRSYPDALASEARARDQAERERLRKSVEAEEQRVAALRRAQRALRS